MPSYNPDKIKTPFQFLGAWLLGLIALELEFILASTRSYDVFWIAPLYAISSVCFVPMFLTVMFLLQTKFRPEMLADRYYKDYLTKKTAQEIKSGVHTISFNSIRRND